MFGGMHKNLLRRARSKSKKEQRRLEGGKLATAMGNHSQSVLDENEANPCTYFDKTELDRMLSLQCICKRGGREHAFIQADQERGDS